MDGGAAGGSQKDSTSSQCAAAGSGPSAQVGFSKDFTQNPFYAMVFIHMQTTSSPTISHPQGANPTGWISLAVKIQGLAQVN